LKNYIVNTSIAQSYGCGYRRAQHFHYCTSHHLFRLTI